MEVVSIAQRPDLVARIHEPDFQPGPEFLYHDRVATECWHRLETELPGYQVILLDEGGVPVAKGHSIPLAWDLADPLPEDGWDFALARGIEDLDRGRHVSISCALWAVVREDLKGNGLSGEVIKALLAQARNNGLSGLIAPVRPTEKHLYPLVGMDEYMRWVRRDGAPMDPWLRLHWKLGGRIDGVCHRSMTVQGTVMEWEAWAAQTMPMTGHYVVPGALVPVLIDCERDIGSYVEPNVWVRHGT